MAKYDTKEIKRAIQYLEKDIENPEIDISIAIYDRLLIKSVDVSYDEVIITIYPVESGKFAEVTKTKRL